MKFSLLALSALSFQAMASSNNFNDYVESLKKSQPNEAEKIKKTSIVAQDLVLHFERAIILGTSSEKYITETMIKHFDEIYTASDKCSDDINLYECVSDLICQKEISHNLATELMSCNKNQE